MKEISAVQLRQSLGRLAAKLKKTGEPILLKLGREPVGVIISIQDFRERFALKDAEAERIRLVEEILADQHPGLSARDPSVENALEELRGRCPSS
ncbi:MAG: type II toxin-antitoxin system Phd/YefM family antitoxin [Polyangia bacterium]|nr:type II toxin-antitoxin system Phd/YefM family antitoxin [Polyangia bacterium]